MRWVTTTYPSPGLIGFPINDAITISFHTDLKKSTLIGKNIQLWNLDEAQKVALLIDEKMYDSIRRVLTIRPILSLQAETRYRLILLGSKDGIENILGETMEETFTIEFMTGNRFMIPKPIWIQPSNESVVALPFELKWDFETKPDDPEDLNSNVSHYEVHISKSSDFLNFVWPSEYDPIYDKKVTPNLDEPGQYFVRVCALNEFGHKGPYSDILIIEAIDVEGNSNQQPIDPITGLPIVQTNDAFMITQAKMTDQNREQIISNDALRFPITASALKLICSHAITLNEVPVNGFYQSIKWFESRV